MLTAWVLLALNNLILVCLFFYLQKLEFFFLLKYLVLLLDLQEGKLVPGQDIQVSVRIFLLVLGEREIFFFL